MSFRLLVRNLEWKDHYQIKSFCAGRPTFPLSPERLMVSKAHFLQLYVASYPWISSGAVILVCYQATALTLHSRVIHHFDNLVSVLLNRSSSQGTVTSHHDYFNFH